MNADEPSTWESLRTLTGATWSYTPPEEWGSTVECWECGVEYEVNIVHPKPERRFCPDCSPMERRRRT